MTFVNNTVVDADLAAMYFDLAGQTLGPGRGAFVEGCIFAQTPLVLGETDQASELEVDHCLLPGDWNDLGINNIDADPLFVDADEDFNLRPGSYARNTGPWGLDRGAMVPSGAAITGEPPPVTWRNQAELQVGGPGITHYRYAVNDGPWSEEIPVEVPIVLTQLTNGQTYVVYAVGKDSAGQWQAVDNATSSRRWTVDVSYATVFINEILAINDSVYETQGVFPDLVELAYDGAQSLDLSGMSLSDDPLDPDEFVFASGTYIEPGQHLVLYGSDQPDALSMQLGFSLDGDGEGLYLFDRQGQLLDSVTFGAQCADRSIGRVDGQWCLTVPTFGYDNIQQPLGDQRNVRINEWLASAQVVFEEDVIELYNPNHDPVSIGGCALTDDPMTQPGQTRFAPLSFIEAWGYLSLIADNSDRAGHVDFKLNADGEMLALFDADLQEIDRILFGPQTTDVSQGRSPDGSDHLTYFSLPTFGMPNAHEGELYSIPLIPIEGLWSYEQSDTALPEDWFESDFDDSTWSQGSALLYVEGSSLPAPKNTPLTLGASAYYFRTHVSLDTDLARITHLELLTVIDDGAIVYVNGTEALRLRLPDGPIDHQTYTNASVGNAVYEGPFVLPAELLQPCDNVIAVEVHQTSATSSDIVFALQLDAIVEETPTVNNQDMALLEGLRISELMYHAEQGKDLDYIEFVNISDEVLDLAGVRITDGVDFIFPPRLLEPGQRVLVVADTRDIISEYGSAVAIAGSYDGNLSNGGERIVVQLPWPNDAAVLRFTYVDDWYPSTDGPGDSLALRDIITRARDYEHPMVWQARSPTPGY
jgi:hypothetical protein